MKQTLLRRFSTIACAAALATYGVFAQEHRWAGRTLNDFEWAIHQKLDLLPVYGVFDTLRFEVHGKSVTLLGQVHKESIKHNAERAIQRLPGVESVVNNIEVLPSSRRDDALRMNVYRALYERQSPNKYGTREVPRVHIIVKNGWVTLEGVVDSYADSTTAHLLALEVSSHVSNNLRVAPNES